MNLQNQYLNEQILQERLNEAAQNRRSRHIKAINEHNRQHPYKMVMETMRSVLRSL